MNRPITQLVITPSYPPVDSSVTLINIKIIEALERLGVRSVVLTVNPDDVDYTITPQLEQIFRSDRNVYRIKTYEKDGQLLRLARKALSKTPINYLPDNHYLWTIQAILSLKKLARKENIDVIHSVSAPYCSQIVGLWAKILLKKPWVCNLVDFWAEQTEEHFGRYRKLNYWLQDLCFDKADSIVTSTPEIMEFTSRRYQLKIKSKFICIPPGYEPNHYPKRFQPHTDQFLFVFLGAFYRNKREPYTLLKALKAIKEDLPGIYKKIEIWLVGVDPKDWQQVVNENGVSESIKIIPRVDYIESMRLMKDAGVLLHFGFMNKKYPQDIHISGKLSEYIGAQRLIFGLTTPEGPVANFIRKAGGRVANYRDPVDIEEAIIDIVKTNSPEKLYHWEAPKTTKVYDVSHIANRYLDVFNRIMRDSGRAKQA